MNEKTYKAIGNAGIGNLVLGIVVLVTGITAGIMLIINGANLLKRRSDIII